MIIGSITEGIVIDHIPAGKGMQLYHYLKLDSLKCQIALIENATSKKLGQKDILKVNTLLDINYEILGFIDPHITVNIIRKGKLLEKINPKLPEIITDVIYCKNPRCITSIEQELEQTFKLTDRENGIYRCIYCETKAK